MRLINFSVTNFRSVTHAHRIALSNLTILIGRNNEGKSNLLRALDVAMTLLRQHAQFDGSRPRTYLGSLPSPYIWKRDFPVQLQSRRASTQTILKLEFELASPEVDEFRSEIGSNLNGLLPLEIRIGKDEEPQIKVVKQGPGAAALAAKSGRIAKFVASRIHFNNIPAVRTDGAALDLVTSLLSQELRSLEDDPRYVQAMNSIAELQQPVLDQLAATLQAPLQEFLPSVRAVRIEISESGRRVALRRGVDIVIDDGTETSLEHKGDGVKSLAALGLLKFRNSRESSSLLAIEEPESHLHPAAIHQVNEIIRSIAAKSQVIITTHNPLFVDREKVRSNVIVSDGAATPARNVAAIRETLGIRASDNLTNANFALVVEGEDDVRSLRALLPLLSQQVGAALRNNLLVLEPIGGAGKLSYKLSLLRTFLCATHCLLDHDDSGRLAFQKAKDEGLCDQASCTMIICNGMRDAEFEDCIDPALYIPVLFSELGVDLSTRAFRGNLKWSQRVRNCFLGQGRLFDDAVCARVKNLVSSTVAANPALALHPRKRGAIDTLVRDLERLLSR